VKIRGVISGCLWASLVALLIRGGVLAVMPNSLQEDRDDYRRLAENLVEYATFGKGDVPTAYRPPLYPLALTGCVALGGHSRVAIGVLHVVLGVATVGLVFLLGRWWGLGRAAAAVAAVLVACDPILLSSSSLVMTESLATFLTTAGLLGLTWAGKSLAITSIAGSQRLPECGNMRDNPPRAVGHRQFSRHIIAGAVLALAALCRPAFLLWVLAAGVVLWWQAFTECPIADDSSRGRTARGRIAASLRAPAAFALGAFLVLSPWAIRNQIQFGRPIVTTTHGGYTLFLANNPEFYEWLRHGSCGSVWQADQFNSDWDLRRGRDELQADRLAYDEAWQTIRTQPGMFIYACAVRIGRFWSPLPHRLTADETPLHRLSRYAVALWYVVEFLLAIVGIWRLCKSSPLTLGEGSGVRAVLGSTCAAQPQPALTLALSQRERRQRTSSAWRWGLLLVVCLLAGHVVYWTDMRMRAPIMPVVAIFAAAGLSCCRPRHDQNAK
jgi:hypothetical protein